MNSFIKKIILLFKKNDQATISAVAISLAVNSEIEKDKQQIIDLAKCLGSKSLSFTEKRNETFTSLEILDSEGELVASHVKMYGPGGLSGPHKIGKVAEQIGYTDKNQETLNSFFWACRRLAKVSTETDFKGLQVSREVTQQNGIVTNHSCFELV